MVVRARRRRRDHGWGPHPNSSSTPSSRGAPVKHPPTILQIPSLQLRVALAQTSKRSRRSGDEVFSVLTLEGINVRRWRWSDHANSPHSTRAWRADFCNKWLDLFICSPMLELDLECQKEARHSAVLTLTRF